MMSARALPKALGGALELTPRHDQPLLASSSAALDAIATPCAVSVRVVAAVELQPMQKGLTSNPMVEVALVQDDGSSRFQCSARWGASHHTELKALPPSTSSSRGAWSDRGVRGQGNRPDVRATFRSKVVKSSLNPIWNFDVDFGDVDTECVVGVLFTVRHVERFGLVRRDIGQMVLSLRDIMELKQVR